MIHQILSRSIGISVEEVERLLDLSKQEIYEDAIYQNLVASLNETLLNNTLVEARTAYEENLPQLTGELWQRYNYTGKPMTSLTLGNWVIGFLRHRHQLHKLYDMHSHIPGNILAEGLPGILDILERMPNGSAEWQKAVALLSLPFFTQS